MSALTQRLGRAVPSSLLPLALGSALALVACASETPDGGTGGGAAGSGGGGADAVPATTCAEIADIICERAEACAGDGSATVKVNEVTSFVYESRAFCTTVFTDQCGPSVPSTYDPRVPDPAACGRALLSPACDGAAYPLPDACGGT